MRLIEKVKETGSSFLLTEEDLYDEVALEVANNIRKDGLWTKALSESLMNEEKAKALYIRIRVDSLRYEIERLILDLKELEHKKYLLLLEEASFDRQVAADLLQKANEEKALLSRQLLEFDSHKSIEYTEISRKTNAIKAKEASYEYRISEAEQRNSELTRIIENLNKVNKQYIIIIIVLLSLTLLGFYSYFSSVVKSAVIESTQDLQKPSSTRSNVK